MSTRALLTVRVETSVLPAFTLSTGEPPAGTAVPVEPRGPLGDALTAARSSLRDLALAFVRPRLTVDSTFLKEPRVEARHGAPFPWPLGLALVLVPLSLAAYALGRMVSQWAGSRR